MKLATATAALILSATLLLQTALGFQSDDLAAALLKPAVEIQLTDGSVAAGVVSQIDDDGIQLQTGTAPTSLTFPQIASVTFAHSLGAQAPDSPAPTKTVTFVDGSKVNIAALQIVGDTATVLTMAQTAIETDVSDLKTINLLGPNATNAQRAQWDQLLDQPMPASDAIVVSKNGSLQLIEGVVGDIDDSRLTFSMQTRTADVALEKIKGVLFYRAKRELTDPLCQLTLTDGSSFAIGKIAIDNGDFEFTSVAGTQFDAAVNQMQRLDFSAGRFVYLSDLVPSTNTWTPLLASPEILESLKALRIAKFNRDFRGQPLTLTSVPPSGLTYLAQKTAYEKGIAIAGGGRVVFAVNGQFNRLTGWVGFDPAAYVGGEVQLVIKTDGQIAIDEVLRVSAVLQPIALDLDITEVNRISIAVEYADGKPAGDVLHLVDFKVLR
jgi:hypothetical protein